MGKGKRKKREVIEFITIHAMNIANCGNMKTAPLHNSNAMCVKEQAGSALSFLSC
jgi:hypothetical protein